MRSTEALKGRSQCSILSNLLGFSETHSSGHYSVVYKTSKGTILKLTTDEKYMEYMEKCKGHTNPMFPKYLKNYGVIGALGGTKLYALELEELVNLRDGMEKFCFGQNFDSCYFQFDQLNHVLRSSKDLSIRSALLVKLGVYNSEDDFIPTLLKISTWTGAEFYDLLDAMYWLQREFSFGGSFMDTHGGNFMFTKSGQLVMTDPVASHSSIGYYDIGTQTFEEFISGIDMNAVEIICKDLGCDQELHRFAKFRLSSIHTFSPSLIVSVPNEKLKSIKEDFLEKPSVTVYRKSKVTGENERLGFLRNYQNAIDREKITLKQANNKCAEIYIRVDGAEPIAIQGVVEDFSINFA